MMGNDLEFQCEICKKVYTNKNSLRSHKSRIHSEKRPVRYYCALCNCSYTRNYDLKRHMNEKHKKQEGSVPSTSDSHDSTPPKKKCMLNRPGPSAQPEESEGKVVCCDCGVTFSHYPSYIKHRKVKHQIGLGENEKRTEKYYTFPDGTVDEELKNIYLEKYHHIMVPHRFSQVTYRF